MSLNHANLAWGVVTVAPSPAISGATLTTSLTAGWPTAPFSVTVWPAGTNPSLTNGEIILVGANSSGAFSGMTRAQEGTSARAIVVGDIVSHTPTARSFTDAEGYTIGIGHGAWSPADGVTYFWGAFQAGNPDTTGDLQAVIVPKTGTVTAIRITMLITGTNGSGENSTFILRKNGSDVLTLTSTKNFNGGSNTRIPLSYTGLSVAVSAGDYLELKEACPSFATNPTNIAQSGNILIA